MVDAPVKIHSDSISGATHLISEAEKAA